MKIGRDDSVAGAVSRLRKCHIDGAGNHTSINSIKDQTIADGALKGTKKILNVFDCRLKNLSSSILHKIQHSTVYLDRVSRFLIKPVH